MALAFWTIQKEKVATRQWCPSQCLSALAFNLHCPDDCFCHPEDWGHCAHVHWLIGLLFIATERQITHKAPNELSAFLVDSSKETDCRPFQACNFLHLLSGLAILLLIVGASLLWTSKQFNLGEPFLCSFATIPIGLSFNWWTMQREMCVLVRQK